MDHKKLINVCIDGLASFKPDIESSDDRLEILLDNANLDDADETFVIEVFTGCIRYKALLQVTVENFYLGEGKKMLLKDTYLYQIIGYLSMFRLNDLGYDNFELFVTKQDVVKMHYFLRYLFDIPKLQSWLKRKWCELYDKKFVEDSVLPNIMQNLNAVQKLIKRFENKIQNKLPPKKAPTFTETQPFNLTPIKPKAVPVPEPIPKLKSVNPVPNTTYKVPKEENRLNKTRESHRRNSEKMLTEVLNLDRNHTRTAKSSRTQERMSSIIKETESYLRFESHKAKPVPKSVLKENTYPIKLNAATILREDALYARRQEEEVKKIVGVLTGEGTDNDFQSWKKKREEETRIVEAERITRQHMLGLLSYEDAMLAKQKLTEINRIKVAKMKKEADVMLKQFLLTQLRDEEVAREKVISIQESHNKTKLSQLKLQDLKREMVQQVNAESKELMKIAVEDAAAEMERRKRLIEEIRAFDKTPIQTTRLVDLTSSAGYGFLCEMSIVELKERLVLAKEDRERELEEKRGDILAEKVSYKKMLENKLDAISESRKLIGRETARKIREKEAAVIHLKPVSSEIEALQRKLDEKRAERFKFKAVNCQASFTIPVKRNINLEAQKRDLEEKRWKELEGTREKMARIKTTTLMT